MGFFSDLKQDIAQAVNELTEDTTEKELLEEEELLKKELAEMEEEFQVSGVDASAEYEHYMAEEAVYDASEVDEILAAEEKEILNSEDMSEEFGEYLAETEEELQETKEDALAEEFEAVLAGLNISDEEMVELMESELAEDASVVQEPVMYEETATEDIEEVAFEVSEEVPVIEEDDAVEELEEIEDITDMEQVDMTVSAEIQEEMFVSMADENAEVGIIPEGMIVTGDISTAGALDLRGTVLGNMEIGGKLNVSGSIQGNSKAVELFAQAAKITGDVECDNSVKIGPNSVVIGNISARSAVIAGAVKGDIDVRGPVILDSSAIVKGNIKSKSVQINNGAVVEGMCSQCYADVNPSSFFEGLE